MRIALLRGDDHHNVYLDAVLRQRFDVVTTVIEPGVAQRRALRRPGKWKDALAAEYHHARRTVLGLNRYRRRFFGRALDALPGGPVAPADALVVSSINDPAVIGHVRQARPDVCVITCVTILSAATLDAIGTDVINIHGGHLPDYRGCHCFFFALYEGNYGRIGSTLHFVNEGIDTGEIIEVVRPPIRPTDNAEKLYCKAERLAAHRLVDWLEEREAGRPIPSRPQQFRGRLCLRRDRLPWHDLIFWLRRTLRRQRLPMVSAFEQWQPSGAGGDTADHRR